MSKVKQKLIVLKEPSAHEDPSVHEIPFEVGNMFLNRFCIDEDAAFELSGVNYLKKSFVLMDNLYDYKLKQEQKGKKYFK